MLESEVHSRVRTLTPESSFYLGIGFLTPEERVARRARHECDLSVFLPEGGSEV